MVSFNTASGKHCCNWFTISGSKYLSSRVSIPQAVSTVASSPLFSLPFGQGLEMCGPHRRFAPLLPRTLRRIPQAVSTVATTHRILPPYLLKSFNTASGKHCCNKVNSGWAIGYFKKVSIPQAVSTVATPKPEQAVSAPDHRFQYRKR